MNASVILAYHSLDRSGAVISTPPERFAEQMEFLVSAGVPVVPLTCIRKTPGAVAITFDDGFANFETEAVPVLQSLGLPATVFVVSGHCGGWNDWSQPEGIPRLPLIGWSELRRIARNGIVVGAHTCSHPDLSAIPLEVAWREVRHCRLELEERLGLDVTTLAYPYGASTEAVRKLAGSEFEMSCGIIPAFLSPHWESSNLPRIDAYYLRPKGAFENLFNPLGRGYIGLRRAARELRALAGR